MTTRLLLAAAVFGFAASGSAVEVVIDYTYAGNFFDPSTTSGQQARATVEEVAAFYSTIIDDSLSEIVTPPDFSSSVFNGVASWSWTRSFNNPSTGAALTLPGGTVPEDEYRVFVGARSLSGSTLGFAGPGGFGWSTGGNGGGFTQNEINQINAITTDFSNAVETRGEPTGEFSRWGGSVTFDTGSTWNFDHTVEPTSGQNDLLSVAIHEMAHIFGFATSNEFTALSGGGLFLGENARIANGGTFPSLTGDGSHWAEDTPVSDVFGGSGSNEPSLEPRITTGTRRLLTELDAAALADIGWELVAPPGLPGDYNDDGVVDAIDYVVWRDARDGGGPSVGTYSEWSTNYGAAASSSGQSIPEPASALLVMAGLVAARRRR